MPRLFSRWHAAMTGLTGLVIMGLVVVVLGLAVATVYLVSTQTRGLIDAFRPSVESTVVLAGSIDRLQAEGKLVVLSADVTAESESSTARRIFFDLIDAGTTTVRVRAPARVQFVVSLADIDREDFSFDPETRRLLLILPNPRLDTTIVEVSTDPSEIEIYREIGWLRLEAFSGRFNEERARRLLRDAAVEAGRSGRWMDEARESARREVARLLTPLVEALDEDVEFSIAFHEGPLPADESTDLLPSPRRR